MKLVGTPLSHFTRKVRIVLAELGVPYEFVRPTSLLVTTPETYGDNPLLRVPTLVDGDTTVIESDHIVRYVIGRHDPGDRLGVRSERVRDLNVLAVVNGIMDREVVLILARRGGLADLSASTYFAKLAAGIDAGLAWLERELEPDEPRFDYRDIATICMWQHVQHYGTATGLDRYPQIASRVARFADRPSIAATTPATALAEATAAGWQPS